MSPKTAAARLPNHPVAPVRALNFHSLLAEAIRCHESGLLEEAVAAYRRVLVLQPNHADAHNNLGAALSSLGRVDEAITHYQRTVALRPNSTDARSNLAIALIAQGRFDDAVAQCDRVLALHPDHAEAHYNRAAIKAFREGDADLAALEALAGRPDLPPARELLIRFALAKALEDSGDYLRAFEHLRHANELKRHQIRYDEAGVLSLFRRISTVFTADLLARSAGDGDPSNLPVFVLGMPRSGSTLVEQLLASHPEVHGAGEIADLEAAIGEILNGQPLPAPFPECVPLLDSAVLRSIGEVYVARLSRRAGGKQRIVNKLPHNFLYIGLIRLILPDARIVHTRRDPVDTCISCYSTRFSTGQNFAYDLAELGRYYRHYAALMSHWRSVLPPGAMLEVQYEDVVNDLEGQARRLYDYCGLSWDDRCLSFHKTSRPVQTASAAQVRKPLFRTSLQRWRRYEFGLAPLLHELGDLAPPALR